MNTYQSRLIGLQKEWVDCIEAGKVSWSNLPPGKYKLEIRQLYQSVVQPNGLLFDVVVIPPFYKTYWFYALIGLLVAGFIFGVYWLRIQRIRKEAQLKTAFHQQLAKVEMSALRAQMNPHFVFNSLNAINRFILLNETDIASTYLTKFSRLIRMILDHSRSELVTLEQELNALKLYIELEALRFDNKFSYAIDLEEAVKAGAIEVPPLLIQPFVENAIWHGLMHQKDHGQLKIHIGLSEQVLWITVQDNGIGRAMAASLKSKSAQEHKSHGMQVTHDRLALMQGRFGGKASFEVIDLFAEDGSPAGTKVNIKMSLV
jgi:LytS/YehU family sensor histidine kinase